MTLAGHEARRGEMEIRRPRCRSEDN